jgi:hypothetical protein
MGVPPLSSVEMRFVTSNKNSTFVVSNSSINCEKSEGNFVKISWKKDIHINCGAKIFYVGDEHVFFACFEELFQEAAAVKAGKDFTGTGGVPTS